MDPWTKGEEVAVLWRGAELHSLQRIDAVTAEGCAVLPTKNIFTGRITGKPVQFDAAGRPVPVAGAPNDCTIRPPTDEDRRWWRRTKLAALITQDHIQVRLTDEQVQTLLEWCAAPPTAGT